MKRLEWKLNAILIAEALDKHYGSSSNTNIQQKNLQIRFEIVNDFYWEKIKKKF